MRVGEGRLASRAAPLGSPAFAPVRVGGGPRAAIPTGVGLMLYSSMKHRTQLYLDEGQYRWLQQRAGKAGSIAAVVRELIDAERVGWRIPRRTHCFASSWPRRPARDMRETSVETLDRDLYGS